MIHRNFLLPEILSRLTFEEREKGNFYVKAIPQHDFRRALPEEIIRQLCVLSLIHHYGYPEQDIRLEYHVQMGSTKRRADVVILDQYQNPYVVFEVKQSLDEKARMQLESYLVVTKAPYGVVVSRNESFCFDSNGVTQTDIPIFNGVPTPVSDLLPSLSPPTTRLSIKIDNFERLSKANAEITIKGCAVRLSITDMAKFSTLRKRFLEAGVVIAEIKQAEWAKIFEGLSDNTPIPETKVLDKSLINTTSGIDLLVSQLLETSTDPLYGTEVVAFSALFDTLLQHANGSIKNNEKHKLTRALINLGFKKFEEKDRFRVPIKKDNGDNRYAWWGKCNNPVEAKQIFEARALKLSAPIKSDLSQSALLLLEYCTTDGRVCPNVENWQKLWQMLPEDFTKTGLERTAPEPLSLPILANDDEEKRDRLTAHIAWADKYGVIKQVDSFLRSLGPDEWEIGILDLI